MTAALAFTKRILQTLKNLKKRISFYGILASVPLWFPTPECALIKFPFFHQNWS
jgi:hypothetical protein